MESIPLFEHIMKNLQEAFQVEHSKMSSGGIRFCGREIKKREDFSIVVTRKGTTERLEKISYHAGGRKNLLSRKERDHSSEASSVDFPGWQGRQDQICLTKCQSCSHDATVRRSEI